MKTCRSVGLVLVLALLSWGAHAQSSDGVDPYEEYGKHLRAAQEVTPLKSNLFGDEVSLYNGETEFDLTDIDLPGNSDLPVQLRRRLVINDRRKDPGNIGGMGEWDLDVPYIGGTFTQQNGWTIGGDANLSQARCSDQGNPDTYVPPYISEGDYDKIWDGNRMHIPGGVDDELLVNTEAKLPAITDGNSYPWVTKSYYRLGCLATTHGLAGESFVAISPSGEKYTFNWAVVHAAPAMNVGENTFINRSRIFLLATEVQDRFGNWVKYTYNSNNQLTAITANDGREIDITWSGNTVVSAHAGARTWSYGYTGGMLSSVTRPDGSAWHYSVVSGALQTTKVYDKNDETPPNSHCQLEPPANTGALVYQVDAPSGAHGTFTFNYQRHYRNDVPYSCMDGNPNHLYPEVYTYFDNFSLVSKQITGAGLGTLTWSYAYADSAEGSYFTPSVPGPINGNEETYIPPGLCPSCLTSKVVTVTEPGDVLKYTFGTSYANNEGRLLQTQTDSSSGQVLKTVTNTYLPETQIASEPFPDNAGRSMLPIYKNPMVARIRPVIMTTTVQDGDTYTEQTESFDAFAQPMKVKRSNSIAGQPSIEEQTSYYNDLTHWVLGQAAQVDNLTTGETESHRDYDSDTALMTSQSRFGENLLSYTYNAQGQLASFTDGNTHTTTLGNYYRGIPRLVQYPNQTSQTAQVDDYGDITAVTDQNGHTTTYTYLPSGWPSGIDYPSGDEVSWTPETFRFDYVTTDERGIPAGHWRRTVSTGNNVAVTYFDAMLRPLLSDASMTGVAHSDITTANLYDWRGLTTFSSYPVGDSPAWSAPTVAPLDKGTRTTYDTLGRPTQVQQDSELGVLTSTTSYLSGAVIQSVDARGKTTTTHYQVFGAPSTQAPIEVDAPEGVTQTIARDLYGKPLSITQSGLYNGTESDSVTKTLVYDSYHRLCRTTEPESGSTVMDYDGANNLAWSASGLAITGSGCGTAQVADAAKTVFGYDELNRPKTIAPPAGTQGTSYTYTATGDLAWASSGPAIWENHYNYRGMLTSETLHMVGTDARTLTYAHDGNGSLAQMTYPNGEVITYAPDARGRPTQVGSYASSIGYFPNGAVSQFVFGNGTGYTASQNARQMASNFSYSNASAINLSEDLTYDKAGNITQVTDLTGGPRSKTFQYDDLNRLTSAVAPALWGTETYTYDPINNLRTRLTAGQTSIYHYDASNKLLNITRGGSTLDSFGYDPRGNVTTRNGVPLQFDAKNQLTQITGFDSYQYDASGRRVEKTPASGNSGKVFYLYNHAGQLMYQYEPGLSQATNFIHLGTQLIADNAYLLLAMPGAVSFDANPNNGSYTVSWGAVAQATSYTLQESANGGAWTTVYSGSAPSTALSGRQGGDYTYQVKACAPDGTQTVCSGWQPSATLGVTPVMPTVSGPTTLVFGSYTVSWTASAGVTGYDVQENLNGGSWTTLASGTTATSVSPSHAAGGTYGYRVRASNTHGNRGWSAPITVAVTQVPDTPTNFAFSTDSSGNSVLSWDAMPFATSYQLTVYGTHGNLGTYIYYVGDPSFNVPGGNYKVEELAACSIAGCSAPAQVSGGGFGIGATAATPKARPRRLTDAPAETSGCDATGCRAIVGGAP